LTRLESDLASIRIVVSNRELGTVVKGTTISTSLGVGILFVLEK
jgi:hypothetical protein